MVARILLMVLAIFLVWQLLFRIFRKLCHFPAPAFIGRLLDSGYRRRVQPPDKIIERSGIEEGMCVLEVGCGSGAITTFAARAVGESGTVYAVDIEPKMLKQLQSKLNKPENVDIKNIKLVKSSAYGLPFENEFFDLAFLVAVLQEIPDRDRALQEIKRVLKPAGILAVTEFLPDPDYPLRLTTVRAVRKAGFALDEVLGSFWNYTARFVKPTALA